MPNPTRRTFLKTSAALAAGTAVLRNTAALALPPAVTTPLTQFDYKDIQLLDGPMLVQFERNHQLFMGLNEDSLLKPFRQLAGQPAPGEDLGGWYQYAPDSRDYFEVGFAPGCTFGQWVSALARSYAIHRSPETRAKVLRLNRLYAKTIAGDFYENTRFPAYTYDKLVCGLMDSYKYVGDPDAFAILDETTKTALPHLYE